MKICIDPGHGGDDHGATFRRVTEKDITLDIGLQLDRLLKYSSIETIMTRRGDNTVRLRDRVELANDEDVDLFVSIHTNADPDPDEPDDTEARGQEIWINPGSQKGLHIAQGVESGLKREFPHEPFRGVKERGLYVLRKTSMPAVLIEVAFIDNSESNKELLDAAVRGHLAFAILRGVLWFERLHH